MEVSWLVSEEVSGSGLCSTLLDLCSTLLLLVLGGKNPTAAKFVLLPLRRVGPCTSWPSRPTENRGGIGQGKGSIGQEARTGQKGARIEGWLGVWGPGGTASPEIEIGCTDFAFGTLARHEEEYFDQKSWNVRWADRVSEKGGSNCLSQDFEGFFFHKQYAEPLSGWGTLFKVYKWTQGKFLSSF